MMAVIGWRCDFCDKCGIIISKAGILYCTLCKKTYGETIYEKMGLTQAEFQKKIIELIGNGNK